MNRITQGHPEAHEKLTARLFWKLVTESGYVDAGNVPDYSDSTSRSLVTRARSVQGARHVNDEQTDVNHESYTFTLDERFPEQERLIKLARNRADQTQNSTEGASATIENIALGRWFDIGAWNIANVMVTGTASGMLDEGTDYEVDLQNGRIHALATGGASDGENWNVTFDQPGFSLEKSESQIDPLFYCDLILEESNQYHKMWLRRSIFRGYLNLTEFPAQTGGFATYKAKATPSGPVTILKRPEAVTLPTHIEEDVAAASSSSSRSSFSSSSSTQSRSSASSASSNSSSTSSQSSSSTSTAGQPSSGSAGFFTSASSASSPSSNSSSSSVNSSSSSSSSVNSSSSSSSPSSESSILLDQNSEPGNSDSSLF